MPNPERIKTKCGVDELKYMWSALSRQIKYRSVYRDSPVGRETGILTELWILCGPIRPIPTSFHWSGENWSTICPENRSHRRRSLESLLRALAISIIVIIQKCDGRTNLKHFAPSGVRTLPCSPYFH